MLPRRRIFRPAPSARRLGGAFAVFAVAGLTSLILAIGLPSNLFGSAPNEQQWSASFSEIRIVDGETLRLGERVLRLAKLDAPGRGQSCRDAGGARFDCGDAAAAALARLIGGRDVVCRVAGRDSFGRGLGTCSAGGIELNAGWSRAALPRPMVPPCACWNRKRGRRPGACGRTPRPPGCSADASRRRLTPLQVCQSGSPADIVRRSIDPTPSAPRGHTHEPAGLQIRDDDARRHQQEPDRAAGQWHAWSAGGRYP